MAERRLAFALEIETGDQLRRLSEVELSLRDIGSELRETKKNIDIFNKGTDDQKRALQELGKTTESVQADYRKLRAEEIDLREEKKLLNKEIRDLNKEFRETENAVPTDSLVGLRRQYKNLREEIDLLSREARELPENLQKIAQARDIKKQIDDIGGSVGDFRSQVGSYAEAIKSVLDLTSGRGGAGLGIGGIIDPIAGILGGGFGGGGAVGGIVGQLGELAGVLGPGGLLATAVLGGTTAIAGYIATVTKEFEQLFDIVGDITTLTGEELRDTTAEIKTISEVFGVEFNEVLSASNALVKNNTDSNFGFAESLDLIKTGLIANAGATDNFLDQLKEYATQAEATGLTQEQLLEVLIRSTQEGIFSDKGIDLVKEGGLRIREQTKATREALLNAFGPDFTDRIFNEINDASITSFEALQRVSLAIEETGLNAQESQTLIADLFAGPGEDGGLRFIQILKDIDGNLEDVVDTTNAYTRRQLELFDATLKLNQEQALLAGQFAGVGITLEGLGVKIKAGFTAILNDIIFDFRAFNKIFSEEGFLAGLNATAEDLARVRQELIEADAEALRQIEAGERERREQFNISVEQGLEGIDALRARQAELTKEIQDAKLAGEDYTEAQERLAIVTSRIEGVTKKFNEEIKKTEENAKPAKGSIDDLTQSVRDLQEELGKADPGQINQILERLFEAEQKVKELQESIRQRREELEREGDLGGVEALDKRFDNITFQNGRELLLIQSFEESRLALETEFARLRVEIDEQVYANRAELRKKNLEEETEEEKKQRERLENEAEDRKKIADDLKKNLEQLAQETAFGFGNILGEFITLAGSQTQEFDKSLQEFFLKQISTLLKIATPAIIAQASAIVGPFLGPVVAGVLIGSLNALLAGSRSAVESGEQGMIIGSLESGGTVSRGAGDIQSSSSQNFTGGNIVRGRSHKSGGEHVVVRGKNGVKLNEIEAGEAVINRRSTSRFRDLLSAINESEGGRPFSPNSQRFAPVIQQLRSFQAGGITPGQFTTVSQPQLINPSETILVARSQITEESIERFNQNLVATQSALLEEFSSTIVDQIVIGTNQKTRRDERELNAQRENLI